MSLALENCVARVALLDDVEQAALLLSLQGWQIASGKLVKAFDFADFSQTMAFVNAAAWVAQQQDHHPAMQVSYKQCIISYDTHSVGGLSRNDFICAARLDALFL